MDHIKISDSDIVPLEQVADDIYGLRILFVNVFGVRSGNGGWVLIDAGIGPSAGRISSWAREHFGDVAPTCILLTHAHFDHVGALKTLANDWQCPIYAHEEELRYLVGENSYPAPDPSVGGGLMARLSPLYPRGPIDARPWVHALPANGRVPELPGWVWIHTPGHTEGHVSFWRESDRALIVGDCFCTTKQESLFSALAQTPELSGPPAYYTPDWDLAKRSVVGLANMQPLFICPGHGQPMAGRHAAELLRALADHFDEIAIPEHALKRRRIIDSKEEWIA